MIDASMKKQMNGVVQTELQKMIANYEKQQEDERLKRQQREDLVNKQMQ